MVITNFEYQQCYILEGDSGQEVLFKARVGDLLGLSSIAASGGGRIKLYVDDLNLDQQKELNTSIGITNSKYSMKDFEQDDFLRLESIEYVEGWFGVVLIGPHESAVAAQREVEDVVVVDTSENDSALGNTSDDVCDIEDD